jgi:hypothetical protein
MIAELEPIYRQVFAERMPKLAELLAAETTARAAAQAEDPDLPAPTTGDIAP